MIFDAGFEQKAEFQLFPLKRTLNWTHKSSRCPVLLTANNKEAGSRPRAHPWMAEPALGGSSFPSCLHATIHPAIGDNTQTCLSPGKGGGRPGRWENSKYPLIRDANGHCQSGAALTDTSWRRPPIIPTSSQPVLPPSTAKLLRAWVTTAKVWKYPKRPSVHEGKRKMWYRVYYC